ncbi:M12 family metallo-peptidase [Opitutales bacterium]|nr:M12 family metallo-peptidase [Opitutales bacterium]
MNASEALPLEHANISTVRLSLNLLGEEKVFAQKTGSADLGNGAFSWTGKVDDAPTSFLSFVCMDGYYHGSISMADGRIFTFTGQDGELLFKPARKNFKSCGGCQVKGSLPPDPRHAAQSQRTWHDGDANLIDLLVVYPTVVKTAAGGTTALQALIASAIADTNLCYQNSLVQIQVRLVHSAEVNYTPTGTLAIELQRLEGKSDGYMDEIHSLRNTYGADLVAMLTTVSDSGGLANTMSHPSLAFESSGFNVNIWDQLGAPSYTLAHEIGHNMGCLHNREDSDGDRTGYNFASFSFGKRWIENGQGYATVMSYDTTPTSTYPNTIPYFSNPDVTYLSTATGNVNSEDNAQVLASTAPYVSNFRRSLVQAILPTSFSYFVEEGNSTSFSVRLTVEPSSPLTVNLAMSGDNDLFLSGPSSLQFDSTNWNLPHPVQISAKSDTDNSAGSGTLILSASGINSTSIQITEIDVGTSIDTNPIFSGVILNELGMGIPQVVLNFSNSGGTTQTDENGTFRIGLTSGWSGTISPSLAGYSFSPSVITSQALSTNSVGNLLQASRSSILYVDRDATGRGDGTSWANAYTDLRSALVSMNEFTEVWVAEGTYYPGNTQADSFILPPGIPVLGGFSGTESIRSERNSSTYVTTLSGDIGTIGNGSDNSYHVVIPSQHSSLDGFVIRDGNASQNFTDYRGLGAGLFADRTEFIISNCSFIDNQSYQRGGGVCIIDSNATFKNSVFTGQFSTIGGVIDANNSTLILESCEFSNNSSELEGGVLNSIDSEVNATNCTFNSNQNTQNNGAGVVNVEGGTFSDVNGTYSNNQSLSKGGGGLCRGCNFIFFECEFSK